MPPFFFDEIALRVDVEGKLPFPLTIAVSFEEIHDSRLFWIGHNDIFGIGPARFPGFRGCLPFGKQAGIAF